MKSSVFKSTTFRLKNDFKFIKMIFISVLKPTFLYTAYMLAFNQSFDYSISQIQLIAH